MKRSKSALPAAAAILGILLLILDNEVAVNGAWEGLAFCLITIIPTLFPFFFLSNLLCSRISSGGIRFLRPLGRILRIPAGSELLFFTGLLGGFPVGARAIQTALDENRLTQADARRMLCFCNNCGPAFLFGMSAALFEAWWIPWLLFGFQFLSAIIVSLLIPASPSTPMKTTATTTSLPKMLENALRSIAGVCGWVILFRTLLSFLEKYVLFRVPAAVRVIVTGFLEISNGCFALPIITDPRLQLILCSWLLAFGGLCVMMQTWFAAQSVDKRLYLPSKLLQSSICATLTCGVCVHPMGLIFAGTTVILMILLQKTEKRCRNLQTVGV